MVPPAESLLGSRHSRVFYVKSSAQVDENGLQSPSARHDGDQLTAGGLQEELRWEMLVHTLKSLKRLPTG